jgi:Lhr-like helicase
LTIIDRPAVLPDIFMRWFASRRWTPRPHQLELLAKARAGRSALLIAPTGGGKTLAGFLPSLVDLAHVNRSAWRGHGLHTLYISPLKALAVDVARNLEIPVAEMGLPVRIETRTGDTPASKRQRQRRHPPDMLLTTPEQLALLLASADAPYLFGTLRRIVLDELHALVTSKRGDLLSLGLARLFRIAPELIGIGLSATVAAPADLCRFMVPQREAPACADLIVAESGAPPQVTMLASDEHLPWAGHSARYALGELYALIKAHRTTLVFVNTRSQAEGIFQDLWHLNDDNLAIALHHGSLDVAQRRKVEAAMAAGRLRAVVCTSSLDLGVDWGDVDLVINVGAPKGASRLLQRIGRAKADMLKVRLVRSRVSKLIPRGGRLLGEVEEYFIETLVPGDTFVFAGEILKYEALVEDEVYVSRTTAEDPKVPAYEGGKFPLSTYLADRVRSIISDPLAWRGLPEQVRDWLEIQKWRSQVPGRRELLVETFPRATKNYLICYPFEGRLAHQTLGMLLTRRLERARLRPLGFVANEYALAVWGLGDIAARISKGELSLAALFDEDMLGDDLEAWLAESALMKRTFRNCAVIAGLIERRFPGEEKSRRQLTISTDLVYDVLRSYQPDHVLLRAARADAATGLLDVRRLGEMLSRIKGRMCIRRSITFLRSPFR